MKIGLIAPPWVPVPPHGYGGTEAVIDRLARGLQAAGHDVFLWSTGDATSPVPTGYVYERAEGERLGQAAVELRHVLAGYEAMADWGPDIVHDHTLTGPIYSVAGAPFPVVTTNHGPFDGELRELYEAVGRHVPVLAISHDQALRAPCPIAAVIHHAIDLDGFEVGDGAGDDGRPYYLFLGRMAPDKGVREAVQAAAAAGVRLVVAAKMREPAERRYFAEQVEPLLDGDDLVYMGEVSHEEKLRLLRGAVALVNCVRWAEPFGLVMIEAFASGTPVLAPRIGSAPELVDDGVTGFLCDDDEFAEKMIEAKSLSRAACRAVAEERFTIERMVREHVDVYERVIRDRAGRPA